MKFDEKTGLPLKLDGGSWKLDGGHLQGVVSDDENNFIYFSFTDRLVKVDMHTGEIVGSVTGLLSGSIFGGGAHLGDLAYYNGKVYGSLEYKATEKFYVAVFDAAKITAMDMDYKTPGVMTTMYMSEVVKDYVDDLSAGEHENSSDVPVLMELLLDLCRERRAGKSICFSHMVCTATSTAGTMIIR